jgi:hypothetical protein
VVVALAFSSCAPGIMLPASATSQLDAGDSEWVVVVYMSADNELEPRAIEDLNEMEAAGLAGTGVTVLALLDRAPGHDASNGDWTGTRVYQITDDPVASDAAIRSVPLTLPVLGIDPSGADVELDTADPATLASLLDFAGERYAPEHLALIVWGHGSGFRADAIHRSSPPGGFRATSFDDSSGGDGLYTAELAHALARHPLDVIGFDTCFGASLELAYELRDLARFMVASQDAVPADGWEYDDLLRRFAESDRRPESFAASIVQSYADLNAGLAGATISTTDLAETGGLVAALNVFSDELHAGLVDSAVRDAVRATIFYDVEDFYATPGDLAVDVADLARVVSASHGLAGQAAEDLRDAVARAVVASWSGSGNPRATGLSVHLIPLEEDGSAASAHDPAYVRGADVPHPLSFVSASSWPPALATGTGLLYRLFYEVL